MSSTDVENPWGRAGVVAGLRVLVSLQAGTPERDIEFTEAVHGFIDDTQWDMYDPSTDIGRVLLDDDEGAAATVAVRDLKSVLKALGPTAPYDNYLTHPGWIAARESMRHLLAVMEGHDTPN